MQQDTAVESVFGPFQQMWSRILDYLPSFAAGVLILLLGGVLCWLIKRVVVRVLILMRIDRPLRGFRWARSLSQADVRHALANTAGNFVAGVVFLIFVENALVVWKLDVLGQLMGRLVFYLPKLIIGFVVFLIGSVLAAAVATRVRSGLALEGVERAGLFSRIVHWGLIVVVATIALEELGIAPETVKTAFRFGLGSLGLIAVLAIGLGSRTAVERAWAGLLDRSRGGAQEPPERSSR